MRKTSLKEIKDELKHQTKEELIELCLILSKFKKENKEQLSYLLFDASNEANYIQSVKESLDEEFSSIESTNFYYIKKNVRKILRNTRKYIRFSKKKGTEVEILLYFCTKLTEIKPNIKNNKVLLGLKERLILSIEKSISKLHEDLQFDYTLELMALEKKSLM